MIEGAGIGGADGAAGPGAELARASLALARRLSAGGTLWCAAPAEPAHAHHVAVEFVHPVIVGKRALPAVAVPAGADLVSSLRATVRAGDVVLALAPGNDPAVVDVMSRASAWGATTIWVGGLDRPREGAADHVIWLDDDAPEAFVRTYHLLWELTHVCFEHPGLLQPEVCETDVCITCSDEGRLAEVETTDGDEATVRTATGRERVSTALIDPPRPGDLLLVHAGTAISLLEPAT